MPVSLPLQFPGASDWLHFGNKWQSVSISKDDDKDEVSQEPKYDESLEGMRKRVVKLVGKVAYPTATKHSHLITKKLLAGWRGRV